MALCYVANNSGDSGMEIDGSAVQSEARRHKEFYVVVVSRV